MILKLKIYGPVKRILRFLIVASIVPVFGIFSATAQAMTTKEAKVVAVLNEDNNTIVALVLFTDQSGINESLIKRYSDCQFYIGLMEGSYEIVQSMVIPQRGTTIIIFKNQPIFGETNMVFTEHYNPGDSIKIGISEARVLSKDKGELIIKIQ